MSLWYESLGMCFYGCDDSADLKPRALCILAHLSMSVPRSWWDNALQTGKPLATHCDILQNLHDDLLKVPELRGQINFPWLVSLAFTEKNPAEQDPEV
jgi:hypothetical protein